MTPTEPKALSFRERAVLRLYGLLMRLARPLLRRRLARRALSEPGYAEAVPERFGHYTQPAEARPALVWAHAVSLGETRAAAILLKAWRATQPGLRVLLTHGTATGRAEGRALLRPGDVQVWQPWDEPAAVQRFLSHFKPRLGVLMETEVWPQLVAGARSQGLSDKSLRQAQRWPALSRPAYARLSAALAQTEADAQRLRLLGATVQAVLGNLKFDAQPDPAQCALACARRADLALPVLVFASSREGEEALFLQALSALGKLGFQPLIVPRHPQRFDEVAKLAQEAGWTVCRRSQWGADLAQLPATAARTLWLGDSLGEMALYYCLSQAALLGGSFLALGGQNLIEAAACGCPVLMGPHTFNVREVVDRAQKEGAALRVQDMAQALQLAAQLLQADGPQALSQAALAFAQRHRGAAARTAEGLSEHLQPLGSQD